MTSIYAAAMAATLIGQTGQTSAKPQAVLPQIITYDHLAQLGDLVRAVDSYDDNRLVYAQKEKEARRIAKLVEGRKIRFLVGVRQVTDTQVFVSVRNARRAVVKLEFKDKHGKRYFGNGGSRVYKGPPSTYLRNMSAGPPAMQIGGDVSLEQSKTLRKRDVIPVEGTIASVHLRIQIGHTPMTFVVIKDLKILKREDLLSGSDPTKN